MPVGWKILSNTGRSQKQGQSIQRNSSTRQKRTTPRKEMKPMVVAMMSVLMSKGKGTVARVLLASPSPGWLEMKAKVLLG